MQKFFFFTSLDPEIFFFFFISDPYNYCFCETMTLSFFVVNLLSLYGDTI